MFNAFTCAVPIVLKCAIIVCRVEELLRCRRRVARRQVEEIVRGMELEASTVYYRDDLRWVCARWTGDREVPALLSTRLITGQHVRLTGRGSGNNAHVIIRRGCIGAQGEPVAGTHLELRWQRRWRWRRRRWRRQRRRRRQRGLAHELVTGVSHEERCAIRRDGDSLWVEEQGRSACAVCIALRRACKCGHQTGRQINLAEAIVLQVGHIESSAIKTDGHVNRIVEGCVSPHAIR